MKPTIAFSDFDKLELRVGTIIEASLPEWSAKLIQFRVDFGDEIGQKTIFSGIKKWYQPDDLLNKQGVFLLNLEPKKMGDQLSEGMMLMADGDSPVVLSLSQPVPNGTEVR